MTIDAKRLLALPFPPETRRVGEREAMLYALAVGLGRDPLDPGELRFVYERALAVVPSMATVIGFEDRWLAPAGIDERMVLHGGQKLTFHGALPPGGEIRVARRIAGLADKGEGKPALIFEETTLSDPASGRTLCVGLSTLFVRGGGGFGGSLGESPPLVRLPARAADQTVEVETSPNQALLFRLLGDRNPLHADPEAARRAGFERPILHGACTFGIACASLLRACCGLDPARLAAFEARFAGPVLPGEALRVSLWREDDAVLFRADAPGRADAPVLDGGRAQITGP